MSPPPVTTLTEEEQMVRDGVARFAKEELAPLVRQMDDAGKMEPHIIQSCFDNGFMGVEVPEELGGSGSSFTAALLVVEELAKVDPAVSVMCDIHNTIVNNCFTYWADKRLQEQWLPRLSADCLGAFCLSEASSGSDAFALRTTARREGEHYVLNGEKMWISNSQEAGVFLVMRQRPTTINYNTTNHSVNVNILAYGSEPIPDTQEVKQILVPPETSVARYIALKHFRNPSTANLRISNPR